MIKVAALQFATGCDVPENLATCLRMIDQAATQGAQLMVLPEFCNHLSWYRDNDHAWSVSVSRGDSFYSAIAERAKRYGCHIVINVSMRRVAPAITVSSLLFGPSGDCLLEADKQTLMGHENIFFARASHTSPVLETELGRLGIFPCRDGVTFETPRGLALRGAQIFCDSLNSFALDEASLHVPARAPENKVFLVAANKVGPLIPAADMAFVSEATFIPEQFLQGAGESQIVSPAGEVLAKGPRTGEAVVMAEIEARLADNKQRPDGSHIFQARRPELYAGLIEQPQPQMAAPALDECQVALLKPTGFHQQALDDIGAQLRALPSNVQLVLLPELCWAEGNDSPEALCAWSKKIEAEIIKQLAQINAELMVGLSIVEPVDGVLKHLGVIVQQQGRMFSQAQLHSVKRLPWVNLGDQLDCVDTPLGRVAMLVGDDATHPELAKLAALSGAQILLAPLSVQECWETHLGLPSRAAENRVCILASDKNGAGLVATLEREFTIMTRWHERKFDGNINAPVVTHQAGAVTLAVIHPSAADNKLMSDQTDLLLHRPWQLSGDLVRESFE